MSTDWEAHYQAGDTPWDKAAASPALLQAVTRVPVHGRVVAPGCGLGHDVRALAQQPGVGEVVGFDIAPSAVRAAQAQPRSGKEHYVVQDLFSPDAQWVKAFDWVWEHTCFCAISPARRAEYVQAVAQLLKPGGQFLGVFYLDPGQARAEDGPPFETRLGELDTLFAPHFTLRDEWLPTATYPGREGREWMRWYVLK